MNDRQRIRYGDHPSQFVEMWDALDPRGLVVMLHGGWWRARHDLHLMDRLCADLAGRGWCVANVEYRRIDGDGGGWPHTFDDAVCAAQEVIRLRRGGSARVCTAVGHSAGGQLALLLAQEVRLDAAVALAPITDLVSCSREGLGEGATDQFMGSGPHDAAEQYRRASPVHAVPIGIPQLVVHGIDDRRVPIDHSRAYVAAATAVGDRVDYLEAPGTDHFQVIDPDHPTWTHVRAWLDDRHHG